MMPSSLHFSPLSECYCISCCCSISFEWMTDIQSLYLLVIHLTSHLPSEQKYAPSAPVVCTIKKALYLIGLEHKSVSNRLKVENTMKNSQIIYQFVFQSSVHLWTVKFESLADKARGPGANISCGPLFPHPLPILASDPLRYFCTYIYYWNMHPVRIILTDILKVSKVVFDTGRLYKVALTRKVAS